mgnify:CR=1 FL=1
MRVSVRFVSSADRAPSQGPGEDRRSLGGDREGLGALVLAIKDYKAKIEGELVDICNDILSIIEDSLIPNSTSEEAKVFYYKMKGDYVSS